jgi:hypothetical protein
MGFLIDLQGFQTICGLEGFIAKLLKHGYDKAKVQMVVIHHENLQGILGGKVGGE